MSSRSLFVAMTAIVMTLVPCASSSAQTRGKVVRVVVTDVSNSTRLAGVAVALASETGTVASSVTDSLGRATMTVASGVPRVVLNARRLGFQPAQAVIALNRDTLDIDVQLDPVVQQLDSVRSTARATSMNYTLGAAEIAASHRNIDNAYDALRALRPNMLGDVMRECPFIQDLWINGRRQPLYPNEIVPLDAYGGPVRNDGSGRPPVRSSFPPFHIPNSAPLAMIRPEHIAEMRYVNCWSKPPAGMHSVNALYITLKPGIGFDLKRGSRVVDSASARAAHVIP